MTRYRQTNQTAKKAPIDGEQTVVVLGGGRKKTINYVWMPDKNNNLVKKDAALVKRSFASLSKEAQRALADYVVTVQNRQPTDAARRSAFNSVVDAASTAFKEGQKSSPWDVLATQIQNAPKISGATISYTSFDRLLADTLLTKAAREIGYQIPLSETQYNDFLKKVQAASKAGGKQREEVIRPDGTKEIVETPSLFDADQFAKNYLWTLVNIGDPKQLPKSVVNNVDVLLSLRNANGLNYLSEKEIANYALQLAKGQTALSDFQKDFNTRATTLYPLFADRLRANPSLTVQDLAQPYITQMAKRWEIDPSMITLDNADLDKFLRPDGTAGKVPMKSLAEWDQYLINHPNAEKTTWANEDARKMATAFARMAGFGV